MLLGRLKAALETPAYWGNQLFQSSDDLHSGSSDQIHPGPGIQPFPIQNQRPNQNNPQKPDQALDQNNLPEYIVKPNLSPDQINPQEPIQNPNQDPVQNNLPEPIPHKEQRPSQVINKEHKYNSLIESINTYSSIKNSKKGLGEDRRPTPRPYQLDQTNQQHLDAIALPDLSPTATQPPVQVQLLGYDNYINPPVSDQLARVPLDLYGQLPGQPLIQPDPFQPGTPIYETAKHKLVNEVKEGMLKNKGAPQLPPKGRSGPPDRAFEEMLR